LILSHPGSRSKMGKVHVRSNKGPSLHDKLGACNPQKDVTRSTFPQLLFPQLRRFAFHHLHAWDVGMIFKNIENKTLILKSDEESMKFEKSTLQSNGSQRYVARRKNSKKINFENLFISHNLANKFHTQTN
jgi:hypothetical protein